MAIFSYRAIDKTGKKRKGLLRADNFSKASELLSGEGFSGMQIRQYCHLPDLMSLIVFSVFTSFVILAAIMVFAGKVENHSILPVLLILAFVEAILLVFFRMYLKQTLPARTKSHLDTGEEGSAYLIEDIVSGEFIPEKEFKQVIVQEKGTKRQKILLGKIERTGVPNYLHMAICLCGYYIPAVLIWLSVSPEERTVAGTVLPAWGIALGLSLLVIPALLVTLALKLSRSIVISSAAVAAGLQFFFLRSAYLQNPGTARVYEILYSHPVHTIMAWIVPAGIMIFLEQDRKIKDIIKLEYPVYE